MTDTAGLLTFEHLVVQNSIRSDHVPGWHNNHIRGMKQVFRNKEGGERSGSNLNVVSDAKSQFLPVGQRHQLVEDFLQSLKPTFMIPRCARYLLFAAMQVQAARFTDLRYFVPQSCDAFFKGVLHDDRLTEWKAPEPI